MIRECQESDFNMILGIINDAAQAYGLVENDNVKFCVKSCYYVAEQDKDNPRMDVYIRKWKEDND